MTIIKFSSTQEAENGPIQEAPGQVYFHGWPGAVDAARAEAYGGLAEYVSKLEWTDAEERYLESNWYYDGNLVLCCIEVPSTNPAVPAKIIAAKDWISREAVTFGPEEFINAMMPEPMSREQLTAWNLFRCRWEYRFPQKS